MKINLGDFEIRMDDAVSTKFENILSTMIKILIFFDNLKRWLSCFEFIYFYFVILFNGSEIEKKSFVQNLTTYRSHMYIVY